MHTSLKLTRESGANSIRYVVRPPAPRAGEQNLFVPIWPEAMRTLFPNYEMTRKLVHKTFSMGPPWVRYTTFTERWDVLHLEHKCP